VEFEELKIPGVWLAKSFVHFDQRGSFFEWFKAEDFRQKTGIEFNTRQSNCSMSQKNVVRGLHFSRAKSGQAKLVTCVQGSIVDTIVDLRKSSKTFLQTIQVSLDGEKGYSIYIPDGFGHGFRSLEENTKVIYNLTSQYDPSTEFTLNIFDQKFNFGWDINSSTLSQRDSEAMQLEDMYALLPD
jgi:dTDP-4-dehydrorhamnose 3,5-epimerase